MAQSPRVGHDTPSRCSAPPPLIILCHVAETPGEATNAWNSSHHEANPSASARFTPTRGSARAAFPFEGRSSDAAGWPSFGDVLSLFPCITLDTWSLTRRCLRQPSMRPSAVDASVSQSAARKEGAASLVRLLGDGRGWMDSPFEALTRPLYPVPSRLVEGITSPVLRRFRHDGPRPPSNDNANS